MTQVVHHYCSPAVFLSFIKNRELWLTSLALSNDSQEGLWLLEHWLDKFDARDSQKVIMRTGLRSLILGQLQDSVAIGTCFSEESDLLSQWRGYASDGLGFSLSFEVSGLRSLQRENALTQSPTLEKIYYGQQDWEEINQSIIALSDAFMEDARSFRSAGEGLIQGSMTTSPEKYSRQRAALKQLYTVKNGAFREEKEWRLLLFDTIEYLGSVEFRESRGTISPFVKLKVPQEILVGVTVGPTNRTPRSLIEAALKMHGWKAYVHRSAASYRT